LAAALAAIDVDSLSGYDMVIVLKAQQRLVSHTNAQLYRTMDAVAGHMESDEAYDGDYVGAVEAAAAEIRVALRLTRRASDYELSFALELTRRLPQIWDALNNGTIDVRRARTIAHHTSHLNDDTTQVVVDTVIGDAGRLTSGQLAARLRKLSIAADPEAATNRYRLAHHQRRLIAEPTIEGTSNLFGLGLAPHDTARAMARINRLARQLRRDGETRTMDQLRADVLVDLLNGTNHGAGGGTLNLQVDLTTLTELADNPGHLAGYGPVIADIARQISDQSTGSQWRYTVTHPDSGQPVASGTTRRRPTNNQRRHIETRDPTCIFPGCRMTAKECDIDHTTEYRRGGPTTVTNSAPLCRHDHRTRHQHNWTYQRLPNGDYQWTTKLGHHYTTSGTPP
jgi:hypothetical protein